MLGPPLRWLLSKATQPVKTRSTQPPARSTRLGLIFWYIAAFVAMSLMYTYPIVAMAEYMGFTYEPNATRVYAALGIVFLIGLISPRGERAEDILVNILATVMVLPVAVLYAFAGSHWQTVLYVGICYLIVLLVTRVRLPPIHLFNINRRIFIWVIVIGSITLIALMLRVTGLSQLNFDLSLVYELREDEMYSTLYEYMASIFSKAIIPAAMAVALTWRRWLVVGVLVWASIMLFAMTGHKSMLFSPFMVVGAFVIFSRGWPYTRFLMVVSGASLVAIADWLYGNGLFVNMFGRRGLMLPAELTDHYVDFFVVQERSKYWWSLSRITFGMVTPPYDLPIARQIGWYAFNNDSNSANVGFVGSGIAQAGMLGVVIYSFLVGLTIVLFGSISRRIGTPVVLAASIFAMASMFLSSDTLTMFFNHGVLVLLVLLMIAPSQGLPKSIRDISHQDAVIPTPRVNAPTRHHSAPT